MPWIGIGRRASVSYRQTDVLEEKRQPRFAEIQMVNKRSTIILDELQGPNSAGSKASEGLALYIAQPLNVEARENPDELLGRQDRHA